MPLTPADRAALIARMQKLAWFLDARFAVPGTSGKLRFGADFLIGLIPGIGDVAMMLLGLYIVFQAWRLGTPFGTLLKMVGWVIVDLILGEIPIAGDVADALLKVNLRNLRMIGIQPLRQTPPPPPV